MTGPSGQRSPILSFAKVNDAATVWDFVIAPQKFAGDGGVRVFVSPRVLSTGAMPLDGDRDGVAGEPDDFVGAAAYQFNSTAPGLIADAGTTDFLLTVGRSLPITDLNVRVNLSHPYVSDLEVQLVSPANEVIPLFQHRGGDGNDLRDARFDDEATKSIHLADGAVFGRLPARRWRRWPT